MLLLTLHSVLWRIDVCPTLHVIPAAPPRVNEPGVARSFNISLARYPHLQRSSEPAYAKCVGAELGGTVYLLGRSEQRRGNERPPTPRGEISQELAVGSMFK